MTFCDEIQNAEFNIFVHPFLQHFRPFDNTSIILLLPTLPPSLAVRQPADIFSVLCCVTSRGCAYVTNTLPLQRLMWSDYLLITDICLSILYT